ncbi:MULTISPECIES: AlbA family DNA-binding domain-containing protein [Chryseobacterium]|uniref:AlbA family DNA-binding domain-containing protein n=1 Tax=Chryseobacterium TaxID=59732 RepID=UPI001626C51F|nr:MULTISPECIES: RNA-binding domain-containing protein [Chryseobacterium]MBF6643911.1 ATP-binding protein [Chryseobacterium indologenes]QQQ72361.1 ATP-binding protein [Chryseobacterium indologenes]
MSYSQIFFNKEIYDINENDVIDFFQNSPEESSILELKSGETKIESIYQEVCALHNMEGGLLIIGAPRPKKADGNEYFVGELTRSSFKNKDWLYQKISSHIAPAPSRLKIHDVQMSDGKYIQIIDIPKSLHPPHQCLNNGIYYIRFETQSRFAPHGLVEAMFNRRQEPTVDFSISEYRYVATAPTEFEFQILNISDLPVIGIAGVVDFYGVNNCEIKGQLRTSRNRMPTKIDTRYNIKYFSDEFNRNTSTIVKGMASYFRYYISISNKPFLISMSVWATNMNLQKIGFLILPNINKWIKFNIENDFFMEAKTLIDSSAVNINDEKTRSDLMELLILLQ